MSDPIPTVDVNPNDQLFVRVSANIQSFHYKIYLFQPDGHGGYGPNGQLIGYGDSAHSQWIGAGAQIKGRGLEVCVSQGGNTPTTLHPITVDLEIRHPNGAFQQAMPPWTITPGLGAGDVCMAVIFQ